jgi:hypothetical protein
MTEQTKLLLTIPRASLGAPLLTDDSQADKGSALVLPGA